MAPGIEKIASQMKKFLRKLLTPDYQISSASIKQSVCCCYLFIISKNEATDRHNTGNNDSDSMSSSCFFPLLENLANDSDRFGLRHVPSLPLEPNATTHIFDVDIVAVHGLRGGFSKTWTMSSSTGG
jgi:hypothetical protein